MATTVETSSVADAPPQDESERPVGSPVLASDTLKRKDFAERPADDNDDASPKRTRRESATHARRDAVQHHRKPLSPQDEKKRNKRLFGGLLSTLSQSQSTANNAAQKRRLEIERRQHERMQKQNDEVERVRREKGNRRRAERMRDGILWDAEVMKNRHKRMLVTANFLKTKTRPAVYYLPAKLSAAQDDMIQEQLRRTKRLIEREEDDFKERRRKHEEQYGQPRLWSKASHQHSRGKNEADMEDAEPAVAQQEDTAPDSTEVEGKNEKDAAAEEKRSSPLKPPSKESHRDHDESGDEVVDAEEDMVIY